MRPSLQSDAFIGGTYMDAKSIISNVCAWAGLVFSSMITQETLNLVLTILSILSIILSLVLTFLKWLKEARKDGHISADELEDLTHQMKEKVDDAKEDLKDGSKDDKDSI